MNTFVAGFVGSPAMSLVKAKVLATTDGVVLEGDGGWQCELSQANARKALSATGDSSSSVRAIVQSRYTDRMSGQRYRGRVYTVEPTGDVTYVHLFLGTSIIIASVPPDVGLRPDEAVWIEFDQDKLHLFDGKTERALPLAA